MKPSANYAAYFEQDRNQSEHGRESMVGGPFFLVSGICEDSTIVKCRFLPKMVGEADRVGHTTNQQHL